ncbi:MULTISPECIES: DUF7523 family protein [Halolamina]|uniref:Uncharacterized protein n=1 Tax=Halolamina pelagica TaxID=699431 RepID=A0A1I5QWX0_9EURY|nr:MULTISPECIES: hypothetical protein [Halolamina]NHX35576.1 hypothetical protein [Halolamina sp. R1-12]SFP50551.1 hypothetical protein SAMN05216277_104122 [Halolamina pelagica]
MSTAEATREAVRERPFLLLALRAGVLNYTATAEFLDAGETEPVATALRRFADDLPTLAPRDAEARVRMESGVGLVDATDGAPTGTLLAVGGVEVVPDAGSLTAVIATGDVGPSALGAVCARLDAEDIDAEAAAVADGTLLVVVGRRAGVTALRAVEDALSRVPQ